MKTIRSFLAINVGLDTVRNIEKTQLELKEKTDEAGIKISWVPPQNMHITMRFLGNVTEPMIQAIKDNLEPITSKTPQFQITCGKIGTFEKDHKAKIIWIGVKNQNGELEQFHNTISTLLENAGFKGETQPLSAHVTIGRIKGEDEDGAMEKLLSEYETKSFGVSKIRALLCYRSDLKTKGTDYHLLWRLPMTGRARQEYRTDNQSQAQQTQARETPVQQDTKEQN